MICGRVFGGKFVGMAVVGDCGMLEEVLWRVRKIRGRISRRYIGVMLRVRRGRVFRGKVERERRIDTIGSLMSVSQ